MVGAITGCLLIISVLGQQLNLPSDAVTAAYEPTRTSPARVVAFFVEHDLSAELIISLPEKGSYLTGIRLKNSKHDVTLPLRGLTNVDLSTARASQSDGGDIVIYITGSSVGKRSNKLIIIEINESKRVIEVEDLD